MFKLCIKIRINFIYICREITRRLPDRVFQTGLRNASDLPLCIQHTSKLSRLVQIRLRVDTDLPCAYSLQNTNILQTLIDQSSRILLLYKCGRFISTFSVISKNLKLFNEIDVSLLLFSFQNFVLRYKFIKHNHVLININYIKSRRLNDLDVHILMHNVFINLKYILINKMILTNIFRPSYIVPLLR